MAERRKYPRMYVSEQTHTRIVKYCKKNKIHMTMIGDKIAKAGMKALGL